VLTTA